MFIDPEQLVLGDFSHSLPPFFLKKFISVFSTQTGVAVKADHETFENEMKIRMLTNRNGDVGILRRFLLFINKVTY